MIMRSSVTESEAARQVAEEIARLSDLDASALVQRWRAITRRALPPGFKGELLIRDLAYRMQEKAFGGLSLPARKRLEHVEREARGVVQSPSTTTKAPRRRLMPGTRLVREWQGIRHEVIVIPDGFLWQGATYASLSTVAKAITGTSWTGWNFFGAQRDRRSAADSRAAVEGPPVVDRQAVADVPASGKVTAQTRMDVATPSSSARLPKPVKELRRGAFSPPRRSP